MTAYYNEIDPKAAAWLRELIKVGAIAPGEVDERSIEDVRPYELRKFKQRHFFAGIGVWSYALRLAGWPDEDVVWTGSCPCQPFSAAGKGVGFDDERHLWPAWFHLIEECQPKRILGEQVASKDTGPWLDLVQDDLEGVDYTFGAVPFPAAGVGAPHIRDRLYWVAESDSDGRERGRLHLPERESRQAIALSGRGGEAGELGDAASTRTGAIQQPGQLRGIEPASQDTVSLNLGNTGGAGLEIGSIEVIEPRALRIQGATLGAAEPLRGFWSGADWIWCRDGKYRPVEPGSFPLAHGAAARVGRLRGYGNAINAEAAAEFIKAYREACLRY